MESLYLCLRVGSRWALPFVCLMSSKLAGSPALLVSSLPEVSLPRLEQLLKVAVSQSPTVLSSNLDIALSEAYATNDRSARLPQLAGSVNYGYQDNISGSSHSNNVGFYYSLNLNQAIYHWGSLEAQKEIGKMRVEISSHRYAEAYRSLALTVRNQYLLVIQKKRSAALSDASLKRSEATVAALEQRYKAGALSLAELNDPKLHLREMAVANDRLLEEYEHSRNMLARLCGLLSLSDDEIDSEVAKVALSPEDVERGLDIVKTYDVQNTELGKVYAASARQSSLEYFVASRRLYPKLGLSLSTSQQNNTSVSSSSVSQATVRQESAFLQVYWNIFDGLQSSASKMAALAQKRQAELELKSYDRATLEQLQSLRKQVLFAARSAELAEIRLGIVKAGVAKIEEDVKLGHSSTDGLEGIVQRANASELSTFSVRMEYYSKLAEFLSLLGADPAMQYLNPRVSPNGKP